MTDVCLVHTVAGPPGSALAKDLERTPHLHETFRPLIGPYSRIIARVSGPASLLEEAEAGLPDGAARPEALAVRLKREGVTLAWVEAEPLPHMTALLELCRARGASSVALVRADPSLLPELQLGSWFQASWKERLARRLALRGLAPRYRRLRVLVDAAFWAGVRSAATTPEWRRLTQESYVALVYHRLAGEGKPGQERVDTSARRLGLQLALLRLLRFQPLSPSEVLAFHRGNGPLPRRGFVLTVDDAFSDCAEPLLRYAAALPQLFVPTAELGRSAHWLDGEAVMQWDDVERLAKAGVAIGSHTRTHARLTEVTPEQLEGEVAGSLRDLRERLANPVPVLAYPNGAHDEAVRLATRESGYEAGYTTEKGRNGAGTDRFCIRRISVHARDGALRVAWKVITGESPPEPIAVWRQRLLHAVTRGVQGLRLTAGSRS
jgi:peptidoglycan/xylan/chitin deacetylase (PgdA/CDA1 family)